MQSPCDKHSWMHVFDRVCVENNIDHRLTKVKHPWTNGQVEHMNRTIKDATVKRYHYGSHEQLKDHMQAFIMAYNFARGLKTLKGLTPYEYICKIWTKEPERFNITPFLHTVGLNTVRVFVSGGDNGLAQPEGLDLAAVEHDGYRVLH